MRAIRLHDVSDIRFEEVDLVSEPQDGQVRIRVVYAGICGSDIHNFKTGQWITRRPSTAGHEFAGIVQAVGQGVTRVSIGDRVVADSRDYCGACPNCRTGRHHLCKHLGFVGESIDGGFADFVDLPERLVFVSDPETRLDVLALAEPLAVALHALAMIEAQQGPLLVIGCGPIGALAAVASRLTSTRKILICDQNSERTDLVARAADASVVSLEEFEMLAQDPSEPVRHVLDTTGHTGVIEAILAHITGGTLGLVGIGSGKLVFDPVHMVEREIKLVGCHAFTDEMPLAISLLQEHQNAFTSLIEHCVSLTDVPDEYQRIVSGNARGIKTLIEVARPCANAGPGA